MARGLWKGAISFGLVHAPVELFSAVKSVVLSAEDFRRANVEASRTVEILAFVDRGQIPPQFFETPYCLAPGKRGEKAYALPRDALKRSGKVGVATVVIRTRQYLALVLPQESCLLMNTLRYADELKGFEELGVPTAALTAAKVAQRRSAGAKAKAPR